MTKKIPHEPDYATTPGEVIEEYMEFHKVSRETLAERSGIDLKTTELMLAGKHPVTPEIAAALEGLLGHSAQFWLNMETLYQEDRKRLATHGGKRPGAGRKPNPPRRYSLSLPNAMGRDLDARAKAAGITSYRWILNAVKRSLEAQQ